MLRQSMVSWIFSICLIAIANIQQVKAVDIYDSITGETTFTTVTSITTATEKLAQEFTASGTFTTINSVYMYLSRNASASTGTYDVSIYSKNTGTGNPDVKVASVATGASVSALAVDTSPALVNFSGFSFTPGNTNNYFIVLENLTNNGGFSIGWSSRADGATPMPNLIPDDYDGTSWSQGTPDIAYLMSVNAVAVPEPSTWAMMSIGTVFLCGIAQRRRMLKQA